MKFQLLLGSLLIIGFSACGISTMLAPHQTALQKAAYNTPAPEAKMDILGETLVKVMDETLRFGSTRKSVKYVERFSQENEEVIKVILKDLEAHTNQLGMLDKVSFYSGLLQKDYARRMVTLVPKFERKVGRKAKTFALLGRGLKLFNPLKK